MAHIRRYIINSCFLLTILLASSCIRTTSDADSPLNDEQVKKRHYEKSYHANEANRLVNQNKENEAKRKNYQDRKRKKDQKYLEALNSKKTKKSKAIPFTIY